MYMPTKHNPNQDTEHFLYPLQFVPFYSQSVSPDPSPPPRNLLF